MQHGFCLRRLSATAALAVCMGLSLSAQGQVLTPSVETVVLSGDQIPGESSGVGFSSFVFTLPSLNDLGQVSFNVSPSGGDENSPGGVFRSELSGELVTVVQTGAQAPSEGDEFTLGDFFGSTINNAGQTSFSAGVVGPDPVDSDDFLTTLSEGSGAGLGRIVSGGVSLQGDTVANRGRAAFNDAGQSALSVIFAASSTDEAIFIGDPSSLSQVVRTGDQAPSTNATFFEIDSPVLNESGQVAFTGELQGAGVSAANNEGVYRGGVGTLIQVAREGDQAPGAGAGVVFGDFAFGTVGLNNANQVAFGAELVGAGVTDANNSGVFSEGSGGLDLVVREGDQAPDQDSGLVFSSFNNVVINRAGDTAFNAVLTGTGNRTGIYAEDSGTLTQVALSGELAPGATDDVVFSRFGGLVFNAMGQVAFNAFLSGPGVSFTARNNGAIYATTLDGELIEVVRTGELFDVNDDPLVEDLRLITALNFVNRTGNDDGESSGFNDQGQVAFALTFDDNTSGIFISDVNNLVAVPEPGSLALLTASGLGLLGRRRKSAE